MKLVEHHLAKCQKAQHPQGKFGKGAFKKRCMVELQERNGARYEPRRDMVYIVILGISEVSLVQRALKISYDLNSGRENCGENSEDMIT